MLPLIWIVTLVICATLSKAQNITQCTSSCGDIHNINFPFRLKSDPKNCGDSRFELKCQDNHTIITLNSRKYNVLEINYDEFLIRAIDPSLKHQISSSKCTAFPSHYLRSVPTNSLFESVDLNIPVVYFNCSAPATSSRYVETTLCGLQIKNSSQIHNYVAIGQDMSLSDLAETCNVEMVVWGSAREISGDNTALSTIHDALSYGFELSWKRAILCRECAAMPAWEGVCYPEGDGYSCNPFYTYRVMGRIPVRVRQGHIPHYGVFMVIYATTVIVPILLLRFLCGFIFLIALIVYKWRRRHLSMYQSIEDFLQTQSNHLPIKYSYSEIKMMTKKFKEKLGEGAYGTVFKGKLRSGPLVAVKMMHKSMASGQEFISEVSTIGRIHHVNVVQLIGFCVEGSKRALVYEFMPNGSLDKYIFTQEGTASLSYKLLKFVQLMQKYLE